MLIRIAIRIAIAFHVLVGLGIAVVVFTTHPALAHTLAQNSEGWIDDFLYQAIQFLYHLKGQ